MSTAPALRFSKMHGAGNDFIILDRRVAPEPLAGDILRRLCDRHLGVGCDQLITIEPARAAGSVAAYAIWNTDGSPARQCGNGARCVAAWLRREGSAPGARFMLDSPAGQVEVEVAADGRYRIALGVPDFAPAAVGLRGFAPADPYCLDLGDTTIRFGAVSMGNPHAVIEVADVAAADVAGLGARLQAHPVFADRCNVGFAQVLAADRLRLRVYERGVGETLACGSGACAAVAVLARRARVGRRVRVDLPGGCLDIDWPAEREPMRMTGPAAFVFEGEIAA